MKKLQLISHFLQIFVGFIAFSFAILLFMTLVYLLCAYDYVESIPRKLKCYLSPTYKKIYEEEKQKKAEDYAIRFRYHQM